MTNKKEFDLGGMYLLQRGVWSPNKTYKNHHIHSFCSQKFSKGVQPHAIKLFNLCALSCLGVIKERPSSWHVYKHTIICREKLIFESTQLLSVSGESTKNSTNWNLLKVSCRMLWTLSLGVLLTVLQPAIGKGLLQTNPLEDMMIINYINKCTNWQVILNLF